YKAAGALFYEMVGLKPRKSEMNVHMFRGIAQEQIIIDSYFKYYDPNDESMETLMDNFFRDNVIREAYSLHSTVVNKKIKTLFANVDSLIAEDNLGILEIKSTYKTAADKYESGIPTQYIIQVQVYMMVLGLEYAEIFMLLDSTEVRCARIKANTVIQDQIIDMAKEFTTNVYECRQAIANCEDEAEAFKIAQNFEPDIQNDKAYLSFLKEMWRNPKGTIVATEEIEQAADEYAKAKLAISELQDNHVVPNEILLKKFMMDNDVDKVKFANGAEMNYRKRFSFPVAKFSEEKK
ncbi:MAG: YqaJ viral recombinase family protein, partial [Fulvivirga sp.]|nr:YqaJ viral recombinase family protein [Fulvivirga sp.]